jgi:hypothetical protein
VGAGTWAGAGAWVGAAGGAGAGSAEAITVGDAGCVLAVAAGNGGSSGAPINTTNQATHAVAITAPPDASHNFSRRAQARS